MEINDDPEMFGHLDLSFKSGAGVFFFFFYIGRSGLSNMKLAEQKKGHVPLGVERNESNSFMSRQKKIKNQSNIHLELEATVCRSHTATKSPNTAFCVHTAS